MKKNLRDLLKYNPNIYHTDNCGRSALRSIITPSFFDDFYDNNNNKKIQILLDYGYHIEKEKDPEKVAKHITAVYKKHRRIKGFETKNTGISNLFSMCESYLKRNKLLKIVENKSENKEQIIKPTSTNRFKM